MNNNTYPITRQQIITTLHQTLAALPAVRAAWQGGSDATGRTDQYSDVDCQALVEEDAVDEVFNAVAAALHNLSPIDRQYRIPEPTWHGHSQTFYRLQDAPPWLLVDLALLKTSSAPESRFLEPERHGHARILFDHDNLLQPPPFDRAAHEARMQARLPHLEARFDLFAIFVNKAIWRDDAPDAIGAYHAMSLRPLIELLRMRHCPDRFDYGLRYLKTDLPPDVYEQIEPLFYCSDLADLQRKQQKVEALFRETLDDLRDQ